MVQHNKLVFFFMHIITLFFSCIVFILTVMSLSFHCKVDIYTYTQVRNIERHQPFLYILFAIAAICFLLALCKLIEWICSKSPKFLYMLLIGCLLLATAASLFWILFNDCTPKYDQKTLFDEARIIAGYADGNYNTSYFNLFPRNKGLLLLMSLSLRLLGDSQLSFRIINVLGALLLLFSVSMTTKKAWKNTTITILTILFLTFFYPIVIYTSFLYGTLLSVSLASCGIYAAVCFCEESNWKNIAVFALCFSFAIQMHQSAAIAMIATAVYLLIHLKKSTIIKIVAGLLLFALCLILFGKIADLSYEQITGEKIGDSIPPSAYIYMGITSEDENGGPGAQDGSSFHLFEANHYDESATNKDAIDRIITVAGEYLSGERSLDFFVRKVKFQWLDPTWGARKIITTNDTSLGEPANSAAYTAFYNSSLRNVVYKFSIIFMIVIYGMSLFTAIMQFPKDKSYSLHFLIQILLIGGFIFQLMWESLSRYCLPYFIWLIPEAAFGLVSLLHLILRYRGVKKHE